MIRFIFRSIQTSLLFLALAARLVGDDSLSETIDKLLITPDPVLFLSRPEAIPENVAMVARVKKLPVEAIPTTIKKLDSIEVGDLDRTIAAIYLLEGLLQTHVDSELYWKQIVDCIGRQIQRTPADMQISIVDVSCLFFKAYRDEYAVTVLAPLLDNPNAGIRLRVEMTIDAIGFYTGRPQLLSSVKDGSWRADAEKRGVIPKERESPLSIPVTSLPTTPRREEPIKHGDSSDHIAAVFVAFAASLAGAVMIIFFKKRKLLKSGTPVQNRKGSTLDT